MVFTLTSGVGSLTNYRYLYSSGLFVLLYYFSLILFYIVKFIVNIKIYKQERKDKVNFVKTKTKILRSTWNYGKNRRSLGVCKIFCVNLR